MNSQVGLLSPEKLANSAVRAASEPSVWISGWDHRRGFGGLTSAAVSALSERHLAGVKGSLVITAIGGLAWPIATAFFSRELLATERFRLLTKVFAGVAIDKSGDQPGILLR